MEAEAAPPDTVKTAGLILEGPAARANETSSPWLQDLQSRGWEDFSRLPMPVRT